MSEYSDRFYRDPVTGRYLARNQRRAAAWTAGQGGKQTGDFADFSPGASRPNAAEMGGATDTGAAPKSYGVDTGDQDD